MLRLKGSKTIAAAFAGGLALTAIGISAAQADPWYPPYGNGWGDNHGHGNGHHGWGRGSTVVIRNGYYYAPPPVYYAPPPVYYAPPPPVYYAPPPPPVYYAPAPAISLQFRL